MAHRSVTFATFAAILTVVALPGAAMAAEPARAPAPMPWRVNFQTKLDQLRHGLTAPGLAAAVLLPDGQVVEFASGNEDPVTKRPMSPGAMMLAGSIGKSIVAATAVSLAEEGRLSLDARISDYVGKEPWFAGLPNAKDLTLRLLLTHSSGIPDHAEDPAFARTWSANPRFAPSHVELLKYVLNKPALFRAGEGFHYSDTNYIIVGLVIEKVTGRSFYDLARQRILEPLGLRSIVPSNHRRIPGLVPGYLQEKNELGWPERMNAPDGTLYYDPAIEWTGGGFAATPADLARWIKLYTTGRAMSEAYLDDVFTSVYARSRNDRYGLGIQVVPTRAGKAYAHGGSIPGYLSIAAYFPDRHVGLAVMANESVDSFPYRWLDSLGPALPTFPGASPCAFAR